MNCTHKAIADDDGNKEYHGISGCCSTSHFLFLVSLRMRKCEATYSLEQSIPKESQVMAGANARKGAAKKATAKKGTQYSAALPDWDTELLPDGLLVRI